MISRWFNSGGFQPRFGVFSGCERRYPYVKGCNSGAYQKISWEQHVTCLAHSKEDFKTCLAEYWGWGGGGGGRGVHGSSGYLSDLEARLQRTVKETASRTRQ